MITRLRLIVSWLSLALLAGCHPDRRERDADTLVGADLSPSWSADLSRAEPPDLEPRRQACVGAITRATPVKRPIDLIVIVDNGPTMASKVHGVEQNLSDNLTHLLEVSGIDYRVIVLSAYGDWKNSRLCPPKPLSGNDCIAPVKGPPTLTPHYFHYDLQVGNPGGWSQILESYRKEDVWHLAPGGWSQWLRPDALKVLVEVSDADSGLSAGNFDFMLRVLDPAQFGDANQRNLVFHAIAGMKGNVNPNIPWGPNVPLERALCGQAALDPCVELQTMAILTGGLRFPVCEWASFDGIFKSITQSIVDASSLACEILLPEVPPLPDGNWQLLDVASLTIQYTSPRNGNVPVTFSQVAKPQCRPDAFYLGPMNDRVILCPTTCAAIKADRQADLLLVYSCIIEG